MKRTGKYLGALLVLLMCVCVVPLRASAAVTASGTCGEDLSWSLSGSTLTISGTGLMDNYSRGSAPWYEYRDSITKLVLKSGMTSIGYYAFYDLDSISSAVIPDSVTCIGEKAFAECTGLTKVTIGKSVASIEYSAFYNCASLTGLVLPDSVTEIGNSAFCGCASLTGVDFPDSVTSIGEYAFADCDNLTGVIIPDSVTEMGDCVFQNCSNLVTAGPVGGDYDIQFGWSDRIPGCAFSRACLTNVTIPDSVTVIGYSAFSNCANLSNVTIPSSVTSVGLAAFANCDSLTELSIPDSVTEIGDSAFIGCDNLRKVIIPASVTTIGEDVFEDCVNLTAAGPIGGDYNIQYGWTDKIPENTFTASCLTEITFPDSVATIGSWAFSYCVSLTKITIPDSVTEIGDYAFDDCDNLTSVIIPESVSIMGYRIFDNCDRLTTAGPAGGDYDIQFGWVENIPDYAFYGSNLTAVVIPDSVTNIGVWAFADCDDLTEFTVGRSVAAIDVEAFYNCDNLTKVTIPASVTAIGNSAFYGCDNLTRVYYTGTEEQWSGIEIESWNDPLESAKLYCAGSQIDAPVITVSNKASTGKPVISWDAVDGAVKYELWRKVSGGSYTRLATTTKTAIANTSAEVGTTYYYKVRAIAAAPFANSEFSNVKYRACDCAQPVVTVTNKASSGKPVISWEKVDGAVKYEVWRKVSGGTYTKLITTTGTKITNTSAQVGETYYYKVRAIGSTSSANSAYSAVKYRTCDCARPTVTVSENSSGKPVIKWKAVDGAAKYQVWRATSEDGTYTKLITTTGTKINNTSAKAGETYYYKVRAIGSTSSANSAYSTVKSITCG